MAQTQAVNRDNVALQRSVPQERPVREAIPLLDGGMRTDETPNNLPPNQAVHIHNLELIAGELSVATGYAPFGSRYAGMAQIAYQAVYTDGTFQLFLVTTQSFYRYVGDVSQWQLVPFGAAHFTVGGGGAGTTTFPFDNVTNVSIGMLVGITLDDGSQLVGTVTGIAGTNVTLDAAVPAGRTFSNGSAVAVGATLNGDTSGNNQVVATTFPPNQWLIVSNCIDPIFYFDKTTGLAQLLPGLPTRTTCHTMLVAHEQLLIAHTIENGVTHPQRIRVSDQADPTYWTPVSLGGTHGIAAIYDLLDTPDYIWQLLTLGPWVIVYRQTTIMRGSFLGLPNETWFWEYMIYGEGGISQKAASEVGGEHAFIGNSNVYTYDGSYQINPIGDPVYFDFLGNNGELNSAARLSVFTQYVEAFDEFWVFYPHISGFPSRMLRCVLEDNAWFHRAFANEFVSISPVVNVQQWTWDTIPGLWSEHPEPWDALSFSGNVPTFLLCPVGIGASGSETDVLGSGTGPDDVLGSGTGDVLGAGTSSGGGAPFPLLQMYDYSTQSDNGVVIPWFIVSRQFGDVDRFTRWERLTFYGQGQIDTLQYSIDEGRTWTTFQTAISMGATPSFAYAYIDYASTRIQFQIIGTDPAFQLRYARLDGVEESEW